VKCFLETRAQRGMSKRMGWPQRSRLSRLRPAGTTIPRTFARVLASAVERANNQLERRGVRYPPITQTRDRSLWSRSASSRCRRIVTLPSSPVLTGPSILVSLSILRLARRVPGAAHHLAGQRYIQRRSPSDGTAGASTSRSPRRLDHLKSAPRVPPDHCPRAALTSRPSTLSSRPREREEDR
jgi:hypothetical protein